MIKSSKCKHVFWAPPGMMIQEYECIGGWYYWDEAGLLGGGPYATEKKAIAALEYYAKNVLNKPKPVRDEGPKVRRRPAPRRNKK